MRKRWCDLILSGHKTWEIRGQTCRTTGRVYIIQCGSGTIIGETTITGSCEISISELSDHVNKHQIRDLNMVKYKRVHAWVLRDSLKFIAPIPVPLKRGAIIWLHLPTQTQTQAGLASQAARCRLAASAVTQEDGHVGCRWVQLLVGLFGYYLFVSGVSRLDSVMLVVSWVVLTPIYLGYVTAFGPSQS